MIPYFSTWTILGRLIQGLSGDPTQSKKFKEMGSEIIALENPKLRGIRKSDMGIRFTPKW